jgi:hypothetical protein
MIHSLIQILDFCEKSGKTGLFICKSSRLYYILQYLFKFRFEMTKKILFHFFVIVILFQKAVRSQQCGVSIVGRGNIVGGNYVSHGQFPW